LKIIIVFLASFFVGGIVGFYIAVSIGDESLEQNHILYKSTRVEELLLLESATDKKQLCIPYAVAKAYIDDLQGHIENLKRSYQLSGLNEHYIEMANSTISNFVQIQQQGLFDPCQST